MGTGSEATTACLSTAPSRGNLHRASTQGQGGTTRIRAWSQADSHLGAVSGGCPRKSTNSSTAQGRPLAVLLGPGQGGAPRCSPALAAPTAGRAHRPSAATCPPRPAIRRQGLLLAWPPPDGAPPRDPHHDRRGHRRGHSSAFDVHAYRHSNVVERAFNALRIGAAWPPDTTISPSPTAAAASSAASCQWYGVARHVLDADLPPKSSI